MGWRDVVLGREPSKALTPTHGPLPTLDPKQMMEIWKKDLGGSPSSSMFGGGWQGAMSSRYRTGTARLSQLQNSYGGTQDSVSWVFSCTSLVAATLGSYPWRFTPRGAEDTVDDPPPDLIQLLTEPNPDWTYFDLVEAVATDLELVGNAYVLKNEQNGLGQPLSLFRLRPDRVRIVVAADGTERGYVYMLPDGKGSIPYEFEDVIHWRYPNPLDDHYGMGTVEAIAQVLDMFAAQNLHITGYFQNGARISGVLTIPETMTETQFERLKDSWRENYSGPANAYKLLIAEGAADYKPISQTPVASGVIDLANMAKDEILSAFGIPAPLLGGLMKNANYKMEESQHIFTRAMIPRARRFAERLSVDLARLWGLDFKVDAHANEPLQIRIQHARDLLGAGATANEAREAAGLEPSDDPSAEKILIPNNLIPIDLAGAPPRPGASIPMLDKGEPGSDPAPVAGAVAAPAAAPTGALEEQLADLADQVGATPAKISAAVDAKLAEREAFDVALREAIEAGVKNTQPSPQRLRAAVSAAEKAWQGKAQGQRAKAASAPEAAPEVPLVWTPPVLPRGFETGSETAASDAARAIRDHQAQVFHAAFETFGSTFRAYFKAQRNRVMQALSGYGTSAAHRSAGKAKTDLAAPDSLFDLSKENAALVPAYLGALDDVGRAALPMPMSLGAGIAWDTVNPRIAKLRDELGSKIVRINDTTRAAISEQVSEGLRRGYSVVQIANGYPDEKYHGVMGVFDQASEYRAEMIARTEAGFAYNGAQSADYAAAGVGWVEILDGEGDEDCAAANGSIWTLDQYDSDPLAHPNCSRTAVPSSVDDAGNPVDPMGDGGGGLGDGTDAGMTADEVAAGQAVLDTVPAGAFETLLSGSAADAAAALQAERVFASAQDITNARRLFQERTQAKLAEKDWRDTFTAFREPGVQGDVTAIHVTPGFGSDPITINRADIIAAPHEVIGRGTPGEYFVRSENVTPGVFRQTGTRLGEAPANASDLAKLARTIDPTTATPRDLISFGEKIAQEVEARTQALRDKVDQLHEKYKAQEEKIDQLWGERHAAQTARNAMDTPETQRAFELADAKLGKARELSDKIYAQRQAAWKKEAQARTPLVHEVLGEIRPMGGDLSTSLGSDKAVAKLVEAQAKYLPSDWLQIANKTGSVDAGQLAKTHELYGRAYYSHSSSGNGQIRLTMGRGKYGNTPTVVLHELSHRMEYVIPDLQRIEAAYVRSRATSQTPVPLKQLLPSHDFKPYEIALQTNFPRGYEYMGKVYDRPESVTTTTVDGRAALYGESKQGAGELFTMGQEGVWYDTRGLWAQDPQTAQLILGMLAIL